MPRIRALCILATALSRGTVNGVSQAAAPTAAGLSTRSGGCRC